MYGLATPTRRFVAADETPSAMPIEPRWACAEAKSDYCLSLGELAGTVACQFNPPLPAGASGRAQAGKTVGFYVPDIEQARRELGLDVWYPPELGIRRRLQ